VGERVKCVVDIESSSAVSMSVSPVVQCTAEQSREASYNVRGTGRCGGRTELSMAVARGWASWALRGHLLDARWQTPASLEEARIHPPTIITTHQQEHAILVLREAFSPSRVRLLFCSSVWRLHVFALP
jgi:hypothetical protein